MRPALRTFVMGLAAAAIAVGGGPVASAAERAVPQRIMSTNVCTDLLLLELVPKARIASVTFLAPEAARALFPGAADGIPLNHNSAEDVVKVRPDLILDSGLSTPLVRTLARQVGARVVDVKNADSFQDIRDILRQVGAEAGEPARAEALIARMDATLADLAAHPPKRRLRVVAWSGGSAVPGKGSLTDAIITAAAPTISPPSPGPRSRASGSRNC
jgi:iron complex transport system substrate-binding protein